MLLLAAPAFAQSGYYRGNLVDTKGDGKITVDDLSALIRLIDDQTPLAQMPREADVDGDKDVDLQDVQLLVQIILGQKEKVWVSLAKDLSSDGKNTSGDVKDDEFNGEFDSKRR